MCCSVLSKNIEVFQKVVKKLTMHQANLSKMQNVATYVNVFEEPLAVAF